MSFLVRTVARLRKSKACKHMHQTSHFKKPLKSEKKIRATSLTLKVYWKKSMSWIVQDFKSSKLLYPNVSSQSTKWNKKWRVEELLPIAWCFDPYLSPPKLSVPAIWASQDYQRSKKARVRNRSTWVAQLARWLWLTSTLSRIRKCHQSSQLTASKWATETRAINKRNSLQALIGNRTSSMQTIRL